MILRSAQAQDKPEWNKVVAHPLQSWEWGDFRAKMGIHVLRLAVLERGKFVQGWQLTFHKLPGTPWSIGYFPKGPLPSRQMVEALLDIGRKKRSVFIQIEPDATANFKLQMSTLKLLTPSHRPLFPKYTFVLDLTKSEEELLKAMHHKTRYNIRVAQRHGVEVREDNSPRAFHDYLRLLKETTGRQGFYAHSAQYHRTMWETMSRGGIAHVFRSMYRGKTLTAWIIFAWKDTIYYPYGASCRQYREVMAPTLTLWEIARWAKQHGFQYFDLWGALGPAPNKHDPWYGFHRFKEGFSPTLVEFVGSYDLVINPLLYRFYRMADTLRWIILKHKAGLYAPSTNRSE